MAGLKFDITADNQNFIQKYKEVNNAIKELSRNADLQSGRIDKVFNSISLKGLERIQEIMQGFPKEIQGLESYKKQLVDLEYRIEQANRKIVELQNKAKQPVTANNNVGSVKGETAAYDALLESINDILGARGQNIATILQEQNAIRINQRELKVLEDIENKGLKLNDAQQTRRIQLINSISKHKQAVSSLQQIINNELKIEQAAVGSMDEMSQSLGRMRMAYRQLTEQERNSKFGQDLLKNIQAVDAQIKQLDSTIGNHTRNVGDYKMKWDGLGNSIQQLAREMPSLAYGPRIFFSAISNNLPILADELKRAKSEFAALKAEGKSAIPVWKQVVTSLFSWQTALTVGITLLTLYGDKLVDWIGKSLKVKDAADLAKESIDRLNKAKLEGVQNAQSEIVKLDLLYKTATNANKPMKERLSAVKAMKDEYPDYLSKMSNESILAGDAASAYEDLKTKILEVANARAAFDRIVENNKKIFELENNVRDSINPDNGFWGWIDKNAPLLSKNIVTLGLRLKQAKNDIDSTKDEIGSLKKENEELASGINQSDLDYDYGKKKHGQLSKQSSASDKARKEAEALRKEQEKYDLLMDKQKLDKKRQAEDLETQLAQTKIDARADGFDKEKEQRDLNNKKEIQALERQKEDYIRTIIQAEKEKFDAEEELKAKQTKGYNKQTFNSSGVTVDTSKYDKIIENTKTKQGIDEWEKREQAMNEYLLKYGTFSQKKEAIDKKYRDAIEKETDLAGKNTLQKEWDEAIANLDLSKLKQDINWEMIFGDLSKVTKDQLKNIKKQLQEFKNSPEFQKATPEQIQVIEGAFNSINNALVDKGGFFGGMTDSLTELKLATEELKLAEEELVKANKSGTEAEKEEAKKKVNKAKNRQQNAETNVTKSSDKTIQHLTDVGNAIAQLGSDAEMSLSSFGNAAGSIVDAFTEAGSKVGGMVGAIFSILEGIQKEGIIGFVGNIFNNVANAAVNAMTFGLVDISSESDKTLEKDIEYLTQSNEDLKNSLDNLADKMDKASVADSSDIYKIQKENIEKQEANTKEAMQRSAAAYKNGLGGKHSSNNRIDKGVSSEEWDRVSKVVGQSVKSAGDFFNLTSENMAKLAEEDTALYSKIKDLANDGYKDAAQYMDEYISYYKQLDELENSYRDKLTNTSFDSIRNDFKSALMDMESDTEDFADNFEKIMQNAIIESLMTEKYDGMIQDWYKDFAEAMKSDGEISETEQRNLKTQWDKIVNQATAERDALKDTMGWESDSDSSRQASQKGIAQASQDSVDKIDGIMTNVQGHTYSINEGVQAMGTQLESIATHTVNLSCLTNIDKTMQSLLTMRGEAVGHLSNIDNYTSNLVEMKQYMNSMRQDINTMLLKGLKLQR